MFRSSVALRRTSAAILALALTFLVLARAWVCDDAFISLRTADHFVNGRGLVWNEGYRVQAYTHPFWLFVVSAFYALVRQPFVALVAPAILATAAASALLFARIAKTTEQATVGFVVLAASRAFLDFGTSGLENAWVHLGIVLAVLALDAPEEQRSRRLAYAIGWLSVTRHDAILLVAPAFALLVLPELRRRATRRRGTTALAIAALPLVVWTGFSLVYYGAPVPNTAYAKLFAHHGTAAILETSRRYVLAHLDAEPFSLLAAILPVLYAFVDRDPRTRALALGVALHLSYIVSVGGDFMLGRFLTPSIVVGVAMLLRSGALAFRGNRLLPIVAVACVVAIPEWNRVPLPVADAIDDYGVADERDHWGPDMRIGAFRDGASVPRGPRVDDPLRLAAEAPAHREVRFIHTAGFLGFYAGHRFHFVDIFGLVDGFVSRLPAMREVSPRAGHNLRNCLDPMRRSFQSYVDGGPFVCELGDEVACAMLHDTLVVAHAPLFDRARWAAILRLNTGHYRDRIDVERYRRPNLVRVDAARLAALPPDGSAWNAAGVLTFRDSGLAVSFGRRTRAAGIVWSADRNDCLRFTFRSRGRDLGSIEAQPLAGVGLLRRARGIPDAIAAKGFDEVLVEPTCGDGSYSLGHLHLVPR